MVSGEWSDFATDAKGGDLVSLYAYVRDVSQGEAAKEIMQEYGGNAVSAKPTKTTKKRQT